MTFTEDEINRLISKQEMSLLCPNGLWNFIGSMTWDEAVKTFGLPYSVLLLATSRSHLEVAIKALETVLARRLDLGGYSSVSNEVREALEKIKDINGPFPNP